MISVQQENVTMYKYYVMIVMLALLTLAARIQDVFTLREIAMIIMLVLMKIVINLLDVTPFLM
jgi:hypothetical protein